MGHDSRYKTRDSIRNGQTAAKGEAWGEAGSEPKLADVLADPLVHLVMRRDGLQRADVEAAVALGQRQLRRRLCHAGLCCAA
ncbi:MAG TPA: hypothetical protein VGG27_12930 [Magnetospirillaceae bacterium]|jgi:hypothetical protein